MRQYQDGFIYLWALFAVALAGTVMAGTAQVWQVQSQRDKEAELLYVGEQFRKAIMSYYNSSPGNSKQYPKTLDDLLLDSRSPVIKRHLRKIYRDPITNTEEWGFIEEKPAKTGSVAASSNITARITGVHSLSEKKPIKKDKFPEQYEKFTEAITYREWKFFFDPNETKGSKPGAAQPSKPGQPADKPGQPESPFAPKSSSATTGGAASSFAPQSASGTSQKNPVSGFPTGQQ